MHPWLTLLRAIRVVGFAITIIGTFTSLVLLWPLTWVNPVLLRLGVPHRRFPSNLIVCLLSHIVLRVGGVAPSIHPSSDPTAVELLNDGPCVCMYTHGSNFDPVIVSALAKGAKHIYKKELGRIPIFGWALYLYRHVAVDRGNRDKAIGQLERAVRLVTKKGQSLAIAPEGTRSRSGELLEFKKGPFHTAVAAKAPVVPVVFRGAYELLPPKHKTWAAGAVEVVVLPAIRTEGKDAETLRAEVHAAVEACVNRCKAEEERTRTERLAARAAKNRSVATVLPALAMIAAVAWLFV